MQFYKFFKGISNKNRKISHIGKCESSQKGTFVSILISFPFNSHSPAAQILYIFGQIVFID